MTTYSSANDLLRHTLCFPSHSRISLSSYCQSCENEVSSGTTTQSRVEPTERISTARRDRQDRWMSIPPQRTDGRQALMLLSTRFQNKLGTIGRKTLYKIILVISFQYRKNKNAPLKSLHGDHTLEASAGSGNQCAQIIDLSLLRYSFWKLMAHACMLSPKTLLPATSLLFTA
jgi:hypothetical protein